MNKKIKHLITISTILGGTMFATNKLIDYMAGYCDLRLNEGSKQENEQSSFLYQWRNGTIFYQKKGNGSPLLLIHDLNPIASSYEWSHIIDQLSKSHTVYSIDLLGCGKSEKPAFTYVNYIYVQLVNDFIQNIIQKKTDLVVTGESFSFAVMAARMNPEKIGTITAINPTDIYYNVQSPTRMSELFMHVIQLPIIGTFLYNMTVSKKMIDRQINKKFYHKRGRVPHYLSDMYYKAAHLNGSKNKHLYASIVGKYTNINIIHALKLIKNPIHFIVTDAVKSIKEYTPTRNKIYQFIRLTNDAYDKKTANFIAREYKKYNSDITINTVSNAGYLPQLERPKETAKLIEQFIKYTR